MQHVLTKCALEAVVNKGVGTVRRAAVWQQVKWLQFRGCHCFGKEIEGRKRVTAACQQKSGCVSKLLLWHVWDNNAILSHNLKHFSCDSKWASWSWMFWCSFYLVWNTRYVWSWNFTKDVFLDSFCQNSQAKNRHNSHNAPRCHLTVVSIILLARTTTNCMRLPCTQCNKQMHSKSPVVPDCLHR